MPFEIPPNLHPNLHKFAWLLGSWIGNGHGDYPTIEPFQYGQEIVFQQDGRPFLHYFARSWVIDENGENLGLMFTREAIEQAAEVGLDLVEISPNADPPVAKFLDIGRYKYEAQKKANEQRKKQKTQEIKEIKMRPNIDDHDYDTKMKKVVEFLEEGDKVKLTMRFRGREMAHGQLGMAVLQRASEQVAEIAKIEAHPRMEGRQMLMVLAPK